LVDQSPITGEYMPAEKDPGNQVYAGTLVNNGEIYVRADKLGEDTSAGRIIRLVEDASYQKAEIQSLADRISAQFIPVNFTLAVLVFMITRRVDRALNMLIIDYSCGVRLSTATAISSAIAASARQGVLIKGGNYLELLDSIDTLVLDKTGTVTQGKPDITSVYPIPKDLTEKRLLELASAAEERATHPMAYAIMNHVKKRGITVPKHGELKTVLGRGVETDVNGKRILVGNRRFLQEQGVDADAVRDLVHRLARRGEQVLYIAEDDKLLGVIGVQDNLRQNMKKALNRLRNEGFDDIILLTGDAEQQAEAVAERIRVDSFHAEVLPENKSETILKMQSQGVQVIMVGDGINDAPALAYADVGISMGGTRTDIAMEAADITIVHDDPLAIPGVIRLARKTMGIVQQNFAASIGINSVGLILSTLGLLPVFWGAVLHNATTVAVVANSTRLLFHDLEKK
jgi:cation-transporting P-type ATPase C